MSFMNSKKKSKSKKKGSKGLQSREQVTLDGGGCSKEVFSKRRSKKKENAPSDATQEHATVEESKDPATYCKTATPTKTEHDDLLLKVMEKALTHNLWFHGLMPRDEIEYLLKNEGDFLLRKTEVGKRSRYAISVHRKGVIKHILLNYKDSLWYMRDCKKATLTDLINAHVEEKIPVMADGTLLINGVPRPEFYILHEHLELKKKLGSGAFGEVFIGTWKKSDSETIDVAIKKLKGMMRKKEKNEFVKEAKLMRRFDHQNVVKVYGVAPQEEPMMIILEFASGGSLQSKLQNSPDVTNDQLMNYCKDGARGMCYLAGRQVIHRDIAARNCLLGKNDELKISDFGLSVADRSLIKLEKLKNMPVKWLSPETLSKGEFSQKSDVWSFGVLMWEMFTRCKTNPYPNDTNQEALAKIISGNHPLKPPEGTPAIAVAVMELCFIKETKDRPEFEGIFKLLSPNEPPPPKADNFETYTL